MKIIRYKKIVNKYILLNTNLSNTYKYYNFK